MASGQDNGTKAWVCINSGGQEITSAETSWERIHIITKKFLSFSCHSLCACQQQTTKNPSKTRQMHLIVSQQEHLLHSKSLNLST